MNALLELLRSPFMHGFVLGWFAKMAHAALVRHFTKEKR